MTRAIVVAGMAVATVCAAFGQSAATPLSFEVASIKPSAPPPDGRLMIRMGGGPGRLDYSNASLKAMIQRACEVQDYQISGPEWMASTRFDVTAKLPDGAPRSRVPEMLRSLLAERFRMAVHRETRELPVYALVVGKSGLKMKESQADTQADPNSPPPDGSRPTVNIGAGVVDCGPRGETAVRAGWMMNKGPGHVQGHAMNIASLVNLLGALLGRPVVDQTGLNGNYDFELEYTPDEPQRMSPAGPPSPPGGGAPGGGATGGGEGQVSSAAAGPDVSGVSLFSAVQAQLGLKLDAKKGSVEQIVVDHIEKTPTDN